MFIEAIYTIYRYNSWANERLLDAVGQLRMSQFTSLEHMNFGSVRNCLTHMINAQNLWLARAQEIVPAPDVLEDAFPDDAHLHKYWQETENATYAFLDKLDTSDLGRIIHYKISQGEANAYALWHLLYHQVNHAAQHRSEVAMQITQFGCSPGWFDFPYYLDQRDGTTLHLDS